MNRRLLKRILEGYGLAGAQAQAAQKGYRSESYPVLLADGTRRNLMLYKREPDMLRRIKNADRVSGFLAAHGFPARARTHPHIVKLSSHGYERYGALYRYLPGVTIPWEAYTMAHIKQLGATMSDMHHALRGLERGDLPLVAEEYLAIFERMQTYFAQSGVRTAMQRKLGLALAAKNFRPTLRQLAAAPGQPLHMDFVRGNILFSETEKATITGILDFEKTAWGPPAFDIARTLAFLLVDCKYKEEEKVCKYFLHSGYNKRGQSTFKDWQTLETLLDLFLTYDFYKFLRHNPYEYLHQNEHFIRTKDLLLKRNIIKPSEMLK